MFDRRSEFFTLSREVAERFLQSAVIVDDGATLGQSPMEKPPSELVTPGRRPAGLSGVQLPDRAAHADAKAADDKGDSERLNAKKVVDSFAQRGIVCAVLRPIKKEKAGWWDTVETLASRADIIILDWTLHKDAGKRAQKIIRQIVGSSKESPHQLRLIVVYAGNRNIVGIFKSIKGVLESMANAEGNGDTGDTEGDDRLTLTFGAARIVVLAKPETSVPKEFADQVVPFDELADRVVEEFTAMTAGLVSNVVMQAMTQVRTNTHRILYQFSADLDAPYLTHRALLEHPDEAEDHLTILVAEELQAILEEARVGDQAGSKACRVWLKAKKPTERDFSLRWRKGGEMLHKDVTAEELSELLEVGLGSWTCNGVPRDGRRLLLTEAFQADSAGHQCLDEKFAFMTTMRAYYKQRVPVLTLGTILSRVSDRPASYLVCIQPLCDCVRVDATRTFPFLPLRIAAPGKEFDIVIRDEDRYVSLVCDKSLYDLRSIRFRPRKRDKGVIVAKQQGKVYYLKSTGRRQYRWVGELRRDHAQRLSNEFAAALSRVGLNESEWLRLWAKK